jgi:hypothetical protein
MKRTPSRRRSDERPAYDAGSAEVWRAGRLHQVRAVYPPSVVMYAAEPSSSRARPQAKSDGRMICSEGCAGPVCLAIPLWGSSGTRHARYAEHR